MTLDVERGDKPELVKMRRRDLLSTGSTLLNLVLSDNPHGGFLKGKYYLIVGDSASGKTFTSMACCAEATINPNFQGYRKIYDNIEDGMLMDLDRLFSEKVADEVEPPEMDKDGNPIFSDSIESFYYHLDDAIHQAGWDTEKRQVSKVKDPKPFIYVLDSMDALTAEADDKKFHQHKKAYRKRMAKASGTAEDVNDEKEEKISGSFGMGKAKINSEYIRKAMVGLKKTGSILIVLTQTRDDPSNPYGGKTRAGGQSLRFYATNEIWTSVSGTIKKKVNDKERKIGTQVLVRARKNRVTGLLHDTTITIYPSHGIDDVGDCVDYLCNEGFWEKAKNGGIITAKGLDLKGTREKIIRTIEKNNLERKLHKLCGQCWSEVQAACALRRKNKYAAATPETEE